MLPNHHQFTQNAEVPKMTMAIAAITPAVMSMRLVDGDSRGRRKEGRETEDPAPVGRMGRGLRNRRTTRGGPRTYERHRQSRTAPPATPSIHRTTRDDWRTIAGPATIRLTGMPSVHSRRRVR